MGRIKTTAELDIIAGSTFSTTSTGSTTINSGTGAMGVSTDASATTVSLATGAAVKSVTLGSTNATSTTTVQSGTGALNVTSTNGILTVNSGTAALNVSNDATATTVSIATGAAAKTVTLGSTNTTSSTTINSGTGALGIGTSIAKTITIGNTTGATAVNMNIGTGDFTMASATGTLISQLDTGEMTQPLQPAFLAYLATDDLNVTGAAATYTLGSATALTEVFDQGSDFNTNGTFTAPVTGRYSLILVLRIINNTVAMTSLFGSFVTSNRLFLVSDLNPGIVKDAVNTVSINGSCIADMDAGDTCTITLSITGGAGNTAGVDGDASARSCFGGCLLV